MTSRPNLPETSHEANRKAVPEMRMEHHKKIISALEKLKAANYEVIAAQIKLDKHQVGRRMSELERMGLVHNTKIQTTTSTGRKAYAYSLSPDISPTDVVDATIKNIGDQLKPTQQKLF